ncbi:hypothetical protein L1887_34736 [Cichorium endivia]|nr:hypothetical protein L1887_34736 [Cichorium endivia]
MSCSIEVSHQCSATGIDGFRSNKLANGRLSAIIIVVVVKGLYFCSTIVTPESIRHSSTDPSKVSESNCSYFKE